MSSSYAVNRNELNRSRTTSIDSAGVFSTFSEHDILGKNDEYKLLKMLKKRLTTLGGSYVAMSRMFKEIDLDGNGVIDFTEFSVAIDKMDMMLSDAKKEMLFNYFDIDKGGSIDIDEFIAGIYLSISLSYGMRFRKFYIFYWSDN